MSDAAQAVPAPPPAPGPRQPGRLLAWTLGSLALGLVLALAVVWWVVGTPDGTAWLLARAPGVVVTAPQGSLLGDFSAERLEVALPGATGSDRVVIGGLRWRGLSFARATSDAAWLHLDIDSLQADRVDLLLTSDPGAPPLAPPQSLQLPIEVEVRSIDIAEFHAATLGEQPLLGLHAGLRLSTDAGRTHRIDDLSLGWDRVQARGAASIEAAAPFDVQAQLALEPRPAGNAPGVVAQPAFDASVQLSGPLARFAVKATLRGTMPAGRKGAAAPSLDLSATVLPFAAWPLGALQVQTRALDLAALHSSAPGTSLSGTAELASSGSDLPAKVLLALANARAGRIDEGLLPVRSLNADVRARPDDPRQIEIHALDLILGTVRDAGGRLQGSGRWSPQHAQLAASLSDIAPRVLDARAPEIRLSGGAELTADSWFGNGSSATTPPSLALRSRVAGNLARHGHQESLQLELDATATASRVDVRQATLQAGDSRATLGGQALRRGGDWQLKGHGTLADFDPALWWPGVDGSAWRQGVHRFNASLELDGLLPSLTGTAPLSLQRAATAQGQATLRVTDSLLAGVPLAGEFTLHGEGSAGLGVTASATVAGAKLALRGRLAPDARDHWELDARAADLAPWSPLLRLLQPAGSPAPALAGALDAEARFDGRWPLLASSGRIGLEDARASNLHLARAAMRWTASTAPQAPLDVQAEVEQLRFGVQKLDSLSLTMQGTAADHRLTLSAASPVRPPRWIDLLHGAETAGVADRAAEPAAGTLAELRAQGALQFDTAWQQPLRWHGRLQQLDARRRGGSLPAPWLRITASDIDAQYDPLSRTPRVAISPGRADLPNMALRWEQLRWQGGSVPQLDLQAEVEPFAVAPLLARLQPSFGWGGDLMVAGRVNVHSAPGLVAEIEFGRQRGDLNITDEVGSQALELTDLRLALDARDGVWHFTQALAGRSLGAMAGATTLRTHAKAFWPPADAPLQGVLELRIADLAAWGAWAPAGWRMKGQVHAGASFGGRFGATEYTGQIEGSGLALRNLVEGIDVHDGELDIVLEGETAQIRKLHARAGNGSVQLDGGAVFGVEPHLQLRLIADKLLLLGRVDRRIVTSGNASLRLRPGSLQLDGRFVVDQGLIDISRGNAPSLGDDVQVIRQRTAETSDAGALRAAPGRNVKMNLVVNLGPALHLRGRGLDTRLQGELLLTAPDGNLAINGSVDAVQGTYAAYGQKLRIERGSVAFSGAVDNPRLDVLALRPNLDIRVGVAITGTTSAPRIALFSDPDLPDNEKLSWLVLGRAPEVGSDTALLQAAAMALLAGEGDGPGAQLTQLNPLDTLSVRQTDGAVRDTVVSVGKQLSQRWYIGYERTLSQTAGNWQLIYRLAQRFTVRLQTGLDNSIDLIWTWRWD